MAQLTHIVYPDGSTSVSIPFVVGTGTTAGTWLGTLEGLTEYYDGLIILYKIPVAGAATTTLNLNGLGAVTCYIRNTTKLTTHYPANQPILLVYSSTLNSGCWVCLDDYYEANTNTVGEYAGSIKAGVNGIPRYNLAMQVERNGNDVKWEGITLTSSTSTSKAKNSSGFIVGSPIIYISSATYAENEVVGYNGAWCLTTANARYITNGGTTWSAAGRPLFLKGTIEDDGKFYLANSPWWVDAYPTTNDGYYYIYIGQMYSAYQYTLHPTHPIFYYDGGLKVLINGSATDAQTVNGHTVNSDVPSNAEFIDTKVTQNDTNDAANANYRVLLSTTAYDGTDTGEVQKDSRLTYNPKYSAFTFGSRRWGSTIGQGSFAQGADVIASGDYCHAEGSFTIANHENQHVFGQFNIQDPAISTASSGTYVEIVGNGTNDNTRSNARTLDWDGNQWLAGRLTTQDNVYRKTNTVTLGTDSTNSVTSDTIFGFFCYDSDENYTTGFVSTGYTDGKIATRLLARNMKTNGEYVSNAINIGVTKAGDCYYSVTDKPAFRNAIGISNAITNLSKDVTSVASGTSFTSLYNFTMQPGTYIITVTVVWATNTSGRRCVGLSSTTSTTNQGYHLVDNQAPVNGAKTFCHMTSSIEVTTATTYHVVGYQNSGSALGAEVRVNYIKLI